MLCFCQMLWNQHGRFLVMVATASFCLSIYIIVHTEVPMWYWKSSELWNRFSSFWKTI